LEMSLRAKFVNTTFMESLFGSDPLYVGTIAATS
jgi:hypothetical protein